MNNIFVVKDECGRIALDGFSTKKAAKKERDRLNSEGSCCRVGRGKDHMGKHGMGKVPHMRRQPK